MDTIQKSSRWFAAFSMAFSLAAFSASAFAATGTNKGRIEEAMFVPIGGIEQWVTIRGDHRDKPILLIVHGGPGDPQSPLVATYTPYEHDFTLVQWDQRGAGKTFARNRDVVKELTLDRMSADGIELTEYLRTHLKHDKVIVLGHSWGTILATEMVTRRPELFLAYVGTGQVSSWRESVAEQWSALQVAARAAQDQKTLDMMATIGTPDPLNVGQYFSWRNVMNRNYLGAADTQWMKGLRALTANSSSMTEADLKSLSEGGNFSAIALLKVMMASDLGITAKTFRLPYYVIQGRDDLYTPTKPAIAYFNSVAAPKKKMSVIEGAGHFAMMTHPQEFLSVLKEDLKLTTKK